jgi:hypothetical protein
VVRDHPSPAGHHQGCGPRLALDRPEGRAGRASAGEAEGGGVRWREGHGGGVRPWGFSPALSPPDETVLVGQAPDAGGGEWCDLWVGFSDWGRSHRSPGTRSFRLGQKRGIESGRGEAGKPGGVRNRHFSGEFRAASGDCRTLRGSQSRTKPTGPADGLPVRGNRGKPGPRRLAGRDAPA